MNQTSRQGFLDPRSEHTNIQPNETMGRRDTGAFQQELLRLVMTMARSKKKSIMHMITFVHYHQSSAIGMKVPGLCSSIEARPLSGPVENHSATTALPQQLICSGIQAGELTDDPLAGVFPSVMARCATQIPSSACLVYHIRISHYCCLPSLLKSTAILKICRLPGILSEERLAGHPNIRDPTTEQFLGNREIFLCESEVALHNIVISGNTFQDPIDKSKMPDDSFELYDLRVEVVCPEGHPKGEKLICGAKEGDYFTLEGEMMYLPPGQGISIYSLGKLH